MLEFFNTFVIKGKKYLFWILGQGVLYMSLESM